MLTILSWNILQGGGSRTLSIITQIQQAKPTICVLSEFRNNESGANLRYQLLRIGYRHQYVSESPRDDNSVLIASLLPCTPELHPSSDPIFNGNIISVHFDFMSIMGVYLPHKKKHALFDFIIDLVAKSTNPYIITGDYNAGKNHIDQVGNSFWYEDKLIALEKLDYKDAFRHLHGDTKEYSWYSHHGNGFRYDHTYLDHSLLPILTECYYLHAWREQKLADHSPMWIKLG